MTKVDIRFCATLRPDGRERIELRETRAPSLPLMKPKLTTVPIAEWPSKLSVAQGRALAKARARGEDDATRLIEEDDDGLLLPAHLVADLEEADARELGLPPVTSLTLQLNGRGLVHEATFNVEARWLSRGGQAERCDVAGARIRLRGESFRLPKRLFRSWQLVRELNNESELSARQAVLVKLKEVLGNQIGGQIEPDGQISRLKIAHAAAFSLDLKLADGEFDFDPVLFAQRTNETSQELGSLPDATSEGLLTPNGARAFAQKFRQASTVRNGYLMPDGTFVFLDEGLRRGLELVHRKQRAANEEKREFARNPTLAMREYLPAGAAEDDEGEISLFVETEQFSTRVRDIAVWKPVVVPWLKSKPNSWLPEIFGVRIGDPPHDRQVSIVPERLPELKAAAAQALDDEKEDFVFDGERYPATPEFVSAIEKLSTLHDEATKAQTAVNEDKAEPPRDTYFLQVDDNLEELKFAPLAVGEGGPVFEQPSLPLSVISTPKPHQKTGIAWLSHGWQRGTPGLLLADDMGLGKTFQALAFFAWLKGQNPGLAPILIVAPSGLLKNWEQEIELHIQPGALGRLEQVYGGDLNRLRTAKGTDIRGGSSRLDVSELRDAGVVLTTFETMRDYHMSFAKIRFSVVVYDEIQKLKNPVSQMTRAAKTLNGQLQIGMTGTPVENRLQDLWSISDVVFPGFLGTSKDFETSYSPDDQVAMETLHSKITEQGDNTPAFMLRRMKSDILEGLPEKKMVIHEAAMPPKQRAAYDKVLLRAQAMRQEGSRGSMLEIIQQMRGTSLHPASPHLVSDDRAYIEESARLKKTFEILQSIREEGEKALIFCESHAMQDFLSGALQRWFDLPHPVPRINGSIRSAERQNIVNRFQAAPKGFDLLILSPKAGGVGLNITSANHVIHLSRWWNPAVEDQATDRVYRIGQDKPVTVHLPLAIHPDPNVAEHSFDRRLDALMRRKRRLSSTLLVPPESDSDAEYLLADTLDWATARTGEGGKLAPEAEDPIAPLPTEREPEKAPKARRLLTAKDAIPDWEEQPPAALISRLVFKQGEARDWRIFSQYLDGADISTLKIVDPYTCAHRRQRQQVVAFVQKLRRMAANITEVELTAYDAESTNSDYRESDDDQVEHLSRSWRSGLADVPLTLEIKSKRAGDDLHDRSVEAVARTGDRFIWDLGRGIQGVMSAEKDCTVVATHEPISSTQQAQPKMSGVH